MEGEERQAAPQAQPSDRERDLLAELADLARHEPGAASARQADPAPPDRPSPDGQG